MTVLCTLHIIEMGERPYGSVTSVEVDGVAQLVEQSDRQSEGRGFVSHPSQLFHMSSDMWSLVYLEVCNVREWF